MLPRADAEIVSAVSQRVLRRSDTQSLDESPHVYRGTAVSKPWIAARVDCARPYPAVPRKTDAAEDTCSKLSSSHVWKITLFDWIVSSFGEDVKVSRRSPPYA